MGGWAPGRYLHHAATVIRRGVVDGVVVSRSSRDRAMLICVRVGGSSRLLMSRVVRRCVVVCLCILSLLRIVDHLGGMLYRDRCQQVSRDFFERLGAL
jgi:hypothetical protein